MRIAWIVVLLMLTACTGLPEGVQPVKPFEVERYLGKWYEIARLDHSFERGLSSVTADYTLRPEGGIRVINRGYSSAEQKWEQAEGRAFFVKDSDTGYLKVSFFGPFYGSYVIFELDQDYQYAFVSGPNRDYLWLLARQPVISESLRQHFIDRARQNGFDVDKLIFVDQQQQH